MEAQEFDIVVIGAGPGGYVAAIRAAQLGFRTACVEKEKVGGICLNWGCIPTKALLHSAYLYRQFKDAANIGITADKLAFDFNKIIKNSRMVAERLSKGVEFLFNKNMITHIPGKAHILSNRKIKVVGADQADMEIEASHIIIAAGARPRAIQGIPFDQDRIISSKEAMTLKQMPKSMVIIGAGAIGVEFAYLYAALGTKVTLIEMLPHILPGEDRDVTDVVTTAFKKMGIKIFTDSRVTEIVKTTSDVTVTLDTAGGEKQITGDIALVAIGVQGNVEDIGLESMQIQTEKSFIVVDRKNYRTNTDGIYAVGDIIGAPWLAHVASAEAVVAVETIAGKHPKPVDYSNIPGCTYCQPQVASIGFTEEKAIAAGCQIRVGRFPFRANGKSVAMGHSEGFAKLIFDTVGGRLLGAHLVGAEATELLAELGVVQSMNATASDIIGTVHAHPTVSEVIKEAAEDAFGMAIHI